MKGIITLTWIFLSPLIWLLPETGMAGEISPQLQAKLGQLKTNEEVSVLISFADQLNLTQFKTQKKKQRRININTTLREKAKNSQVEVKNFLLKNNGRNIKSLWISNSLATTVPSHVVDAIAQLPGVTRVVIDGVVNIPETTISSSSADLTWNIDVSGAFELWQQGYDGNGVVVAIMDTGIDLAHQDLQTRWRGGNNSWYDPNGEHASPYDNDGHGTQVTGIILGGNSGGSSIGMAPGAQWIGVKIFNDNGDASYSSIHLGFQWLLDPDNDPQTDDMPHLVNNSWGLDGLLGLCSTEFQSDIQRLEASGIAVNFSAGNTGPGQASSISPANYPESFAVGGVDMDLTVSDFSSRGPSSCDGGFYPAMVAPAVDIQTSDRTFGGIFPDNYAIVSGTSFAVPHISGAMALLKNVSPWLTVSDLQLILTRSAMDIWPSGPDNDSGYGLVDMAHALTLLQENTCTGIDGQPYFSINGCEAPPNGCIDGCQSPPGNSINPALYLLLGNATLHEEDYNFYPTLLTGKTFFGQLISTKKGYYESTI